MLTPLKTIPAVLLLASLLGACGKLDAPAPGTWRAEVTLRGGAVPFELQVGDEDGRTTMAVVRPQDTLALTDVHTQEGRLQAVLPDGAGVLHATIGRRSLKGEVRLTDPQGRPQTLPFAAELTGTPYRFVERPGTDNADVSGYWQLEVLHPDHFTTPVTLHLEQRFDAVDGWLVLPDGNQLAVLGQVNGDEVHLSTLAQGRAMLLKGEVDSQGELQGEAWTNLSAASKWVAQRLTGDQAAVLAGEQEPLRTVALPWDIPTQ